MRFTVRVRRVGGVKGHRPALGITIPTIVCDDLHLKIGDEIKVTIHHAVLSSLQAKNEQTQKPRKNL